MAETGGSHAACPLYACPVHQCLVRNRLLYAGRGLQPPVGGGLTPLAGAAGGAVGQRSAPVLERRHRQGDFIDDKSGKPVGIHKFIGRRPIAAFGNSDGDFEMLEWTTSGPGVRFGLLVHHDDDAREAAYDRESPIGKLARGLDEAPIRGWTVVSMKDDWKRVYPFED
jgi:hypothetical protein